MDLNKLVRASIFTALAIGLGFSLLMVPNVELITVIVFLSGLTLGVRWGILVGGTAEFIFSVLNPFGSGLGISAIIDFAGSVNDFDWCFWWHFKVCFF